MRQTIRPAAALALALAAAPLAAADFTVTRLDDPAPDACLPGDCSLREALIAANALSGPDLILLGAGLHQVSRTGEPPPEAPVSSGPLFTQEDVEIRGLGPDQTQVQGSLGLSVLFGALDPESGAPLLHLSDLRIQNFQSLGDFLPSAVLAYLAQLRLTRVDMVGNSGPLAGAVMAFASSLDVSESRFIDNAAISPNAEPRGGAMLVFGGSTSIRDSHFEGNRTEGGGGAIVFPDVTPIPLGDVVLTGNSFIDNAAVGDGGAIWLTAQTGINRIDLGGSSFVANVAGGSGGALWFGMEDDSASSTLFEVDLAGTLFQDNRAGVGCGAYRFDLPAAVSLLTPPVLSAVDARFIGNQALGTHGGALCSHGEASFLRATLQGNSAASRGGAISHDGGLLDVQQSTLSGNSAGGSGGAIYATAPVELRLSTLSGNQATTSGGALYVSGPGTSLLRRVTVAANTSPVGSAVRVFRGVSTTLLNLDNSLLQGACTADQAAALGDLGQNVESPGDTCDLNSAFNGVNISSGALDLGPLADNGGPTLTHLPGAASAALNRILVAPPGCVQLDQRGFTGPGGNCDSGSVERGAALLTEDIFADGFEP